VKDAYQLDRPISFKGNEMNPKAFIEGVEPKQTLRTVTFELLAMDPRTREGRTELKKKVVPLVVDKIVDKVASKGGSEVPGLIKSGRDFYRAAHGLKSEPLSEVYDDTSAVIDMLEFRMQAIKAEFADSGRTDPQTFESIAELSMETQKVVQTLNRNQNFIELIAPKPYAGGRRSLNGMSRSVPVRRMSFG